MIFIKNKKAWKEFIKNSTDDTLVGDRQPNTYPCFLELTGCHWMSEGREWEIIYKPDLQSMINKLDSGREF